METIAFIQGVLTVIGLLMVGGVVWMIFKVKELTERLSRVSKELETLERDLHLRVDDESKEIDKKIDDIYRTTDSRFDKFEARISKKQLLTD
jgi:beta-lactamase regulating signal transducer with metallopeptidase domain